MHTSSETKTSTRKGGRRQTRRCGFVPQDRRLLTHPCVLAYSLAEPQSEAGVVGCFEKKADRLAMRAPASVADLIEETMGRDVQRVILVTGASSGIGRACAIALSRNGHTVYGTTRREPADVRAEVRRGVDPSCHLEFLRVDVTDTQAVQDAVGQILAASGRIDALINCAGFGNAGAIEDSTAADLLAVLDTNLLGTLRCCRAVLPQMRRQCSGTIVNISSIAGRMGIPFQGSYSASKHAVEGMTEALRMEVRPFGVNVVLVEPGDFKTGFTERRQITSLAKDNPVYASQMRRSLSVMEKDEQGGATPEPVARLVARILETASPRVRYVAGPVSEKVAAGLKRVLPSRWFERILMMYYRIDRGSQSGQSLDR